jgi:hypothetical protein
LVGEGNEVLRFGRCRFEWHRQAQLALSYRLKKDFDSSTHVASASNNHSIGRYLLANFISFLIRLFITNTLVANFNLEC